MKLSVSSYNNYRSCNRKYYIEKVLGWKSTTIKPWLVFGSKFDELMGFADVLGVDSALEKVDELFVDPYHAANAEFLLLKWNSKYSEDLQPPIEVGGQQGNQYEINVDLSHMVGDRFELIFNGFIDKVYSHNGEAAINERKTTSDMINDDYNKKSLPINDRSAYWNRLLFDPQIVGYSFGLGYELDMSVSHITYEVFRKPSEAIDKSLFKKDEKPSAYRDRLLNSIDSRVARDAQMVNRKSVYITDDMREAWLYEFIQAAQDIHDKKIISASMDAPELEWARNKDACDNFTGCEFKEFCGCNSDLENISFIKRR